MDLTYLYSMPPEEYATERARIVREKIESAPPEHREALQETQRLIDASDSGDSMNNLQFLSDCMVDRLKLLHDTLNTLIGGRDK